MKKFVIERNFPGASELSPQELQSISLACFESVNKLDRPYTWVQSFIAVDKIYCIHIAESEELIREHSRLAKLPVNRIYEVITIIDPTNSNPLIGRKISNNKI
jgi:hypothetical protein